MQKELSILPTPNQNTSCYDDLTFIASTEIKQNIKALNNPNRIPTEAINYLLKNQAASIPALYTLVENLINNYQDICIQRNDYLYILLLLAKMREQKAHLLITKLFYLPKEWIEAFFDDFFLDAMPSVLISTFDGNLEPLKKIARNPHIDAFDRSSIFSAFTGLIIEKKISRIEVIQFYKEITCSPLMKCEDFASLLVSSICDIYPGELENEIKRLFAQNKIDEMCIRYSEVEDALNKGLKKCLDESAATGDHKPVANIEDYVKYFYDNEPDLKENNDDQHLLNTFEQLDQTHEVPIESINYIIKNADSCTQYLINTIENLLLLQRPNNEYKYILTVYLLAHLKEQKAFPLIVQLFQKPFDWLKRIFGDVISESFGRILLSTYNGNLEAIKEVIEHEGISPWCRRQALNCLLGLFKAQKIQKEDITSYLHKLLKDELIEEPLVMEHIIETCCILRPEQAYEDLLIYIQRLHEKTEFCFLNDRFLEDCLNMPETERLERYIYSKDCFDNISNVQNEIAWLYRKQTFTPSNDETSFSPSHKPAISIKIGRNEKCICGSGKKYKKCCL